MSTMLLWVGISRFKERGNDDHDFVFSGTKHGIRANYVWSTGQDLELELKGVEEIIIESLMLANSSHDNRIPT
jgi:hypothetical protein